jgi:hypothetical protein
MPKRRVLPADYIARRWLYLPEKARYDWIMQQAALSGANLPRLVTEAMTAIEAEFEPLLAVLPKDYGLFETRVLEDLMRLFNSEQIRQATETCAGASTSTFSSGFHPEGPRQRPRPSTQDEHSLAGRCDFVMANPPFNVDLVDAERIKGDPRLPFGLPGVSSWTNCMGFCPARPSPRRRPRRLPPASMISCGTEARAAGSSMRRRRS